MGFLIIHLRHLCFIFRMGGLAGNLKALALQEEEHNALERDLERQLVNIFIGKSYLTNKKKFIKELFQILFVY